MTTEASKIFESEDEFDQEKETSSLFSDTEAGDSFIENISQRSSIGFYNSMDEIKPEKMAEAPEKIDQDNIKNDENSPSVSETPDFNGRLLSNDLDLSNPLNISENSAAKKMADWSLDFGRANLVKGMRGGKLLMYESSKQPGKKFKFRRLKSTNNGQDYYACTDCFDIRKINRLSCSIPIVFVKDGRFVGRDPDHLPTEHICLIDKSLTTSTRSSSKSKKSPTKSTLNGVAVPKNLEITPRAVSKRKLSSNSNPGSSSIIKRFRLSPKDFHKDFGQANFVEGKNSALVMEWQSKKYPGKMFYFHIANRYPNGNQALRCRSCSNLKHVHKLPFKVPYIFVHNGRVVGKDPDNPGTEHFCQPEFPNYPVIKKRARKSTQETPTTSTEQIEPDTSINNTNTPENLTTQTDEYDEEMNQELLTSIDCTSQNSLNETSLKYEDPDTSQNVADDSNIEESITKPSSPNSSVVKDYGAAEILQDKNGHYILYESVTYPGFTYRFQLYGYLKGLPIYYRCILCTRKKKSLGLICKLPVIIYRDGRIIDRDPDLPAGIEHICHPESQSTNIKQESSIPIETNEVRFTQEICSTPDKNENESDYGPAEFNEVKLGADRLVYASKRIPGHTFQFFRMGGPLKHMCKCVDCARIKKQKKLDCKIPSVKILNGRIVEIDPDCPKNPHFCIQKLATKPNSPKKSMPNFLSPILPVRSKSKDYGVQNSSTKILTKQCSSSSNMTRAKKGLASSLSTQNQNVQPTLFQASIEHYPLEEYSYLTRKVQFETDWRLEGQKVQLPCADRLVYARMKFPMNNFPRSDEIVRAQKLLKEQFDLATSNFLNDASTNTLLLVDSLFHTLDETVLSKTAVVRAAFPVQPKWIMPHMMILCSMFQKLPTIVYGLGFDWVLHSLHETPNYIANLVSDQLEDIIETMSQNRANTGGGDVKIVFITIPEIGDYKQQFEDFNQAMRILIHDKSKQLNNCSLEVLDWARLVENADPGHKETVDQRLRLLFATE